MAGPRPVVSAGKRLVKTTAYRLGVNRLLARLVGRSMIIGYHRVVDASDSLLVRRIGFVTADELTFQISYLQSLGYSVVSLDQVVGGGTGRKLAITFDDGFGDLYANAFPRLKALGAPFTLFLISSLPGARSLLWQHKLYLLLDAMPAARRQGALETAMRGSGVQPDVTDTGAPLDALLNQLISRTPSREILAVIGALEAKHPIDASTEAACAAGLYVSMAELREMCGDGLRVEAHGHEHWNLTTLSEAERATEITRCAEWIEREWGRRPVAYAIAHGACDAAARRTLETQGMAMIVAGRHGLCDRRTIPSDLPRIWPRGVQAEFAWMITRVLCAELSVHRGGIRR